MWKQGFWLALIILVAAALRLTGLDWDGYHHYHPDERYITWVATTIEWPDNWSTAFDPQQSTFNPFYWPPDAGSPGIEVLQDEARRFAYGHVPLYLGVAATRLAEWLGPPLIPLLPKQWTLTTDLLNSAGRVEFNHLTAVTRALTGLVDVGTVLLVFLLGRRLYTPAVGLLAAAFLALNVMHIQLAHFFASDPYLTFFTTAALLFMVYSKPQERPAALHLQLSIVFLLMAVVSTGLAIGSKFNAVLLLLPLSWAAWSHSPKGRRLPRLLAVWTATALTFLIANPFAWLDWTCEVINPAISVGPLQIPALDWRSCYLENIIAQGGMVGGRSGLAFTYQYEGTLPYLYPIEMQLRWGMGLLLGLAAFSGLLWAIWRA